MVLYLLQELLCGLNSYKNNKITKPQNLGELGIEKESKLETDKTLDNSGRLKG